MEPKEPIQPRKMFLFINAQGQRITKMAMIPKSEKEAQKNRDTERMSKAFIPFLSLAYSTAKAPEVANNAGKMYVKGGTKDKPEYSFYETLTMFPVGVRGLVTSHEDGDNTVEDSVRCALVKSKGAEPDGLYNSNKVKRFLEDAADDGLNVKYNREILFYCKETDGYLIYTFKESTNDDCDVFDELSEEKKMMTVSVYQRDSNFTWYSIKPELTSEDYAVDENLEDRLDLFYGWTKALK